MMERSLTFRAWENALTLRDPIPPPPLDARALRIELPAQGMTGHFGIMAVAGFIFAILGAGLCLVFSGTAEAKGNNKSLLFALLLTIPFIALGLWMVYTSIYCAVQRVTIEADDSTLHVTVRGLFSRHYAFPRSDLHDLKLRAYAFGAQWQNPANLVACLHGQRQKTIFRRYGTDEMKRVRESLRVHLWPERLDQEPRLHPPVSGFLTVTSNGPELQIHLAPQPARQAFPGSFYLGHIFALGVPCVAAVVAATVLLTEKDPSARTLAVAGSVGASAFFFALGAAIIIWVKKAAEKTADIRLSPNRIVISAIHRSDREHYDWSADAIHAIRTGHMAFNANSQYSQQLEIILLTGKAVTLFGGRDFDDLTWLAEVAANVMKIKPAPEHCRDFFTLLSAPDENTPARIPPRLQAFDQMLIRSHFRREPHPATLILTFTPPSKRQPPKTTARIEMTEQQLRLRWHATFRDDTLRLSIREIQALGMGRDSDDPPHICFTLRDGTQSQALTGYPRDQLEILVKALSAALGLLPIT
jgi:hypothetical protein